MRKANNFFDKFKHSYKNNRGSALITVLVLLLIFAVIGSVVLVITTNNLYVSRRMSEYEEAYYVAESNAQYALSFVKEEITAYYVFLESIATADKYTYEIAMKSFYPNIVQRVVYDPENPDNIAFIPIDYSEKGIDTTVTISVDPNTPLPTYGFGEEGDSVRFLIESVAEFENTRRVVHAVIEVDDPDVSWDMTSAPPMTDMRMLIGNEIVLTDDLQNNEYNSIFCRGSALIAYAFVPQFLEDHQEFLNTYSYDFSNAVPSMLNWDLDYEEFPTCLIFKKQDGDSLEDNFNRLFTAATYGTELNEDLYDWRNLWMNYTAIKSYAPATYPNSQIIDSSVSSSDVDYYYTQSTQKDTRRTNRYEGTEADPVRIYASGNLYLKGTKNLENCYIYAEGYVYININGHIENCIIISNQSYIYIDCDYIVNNTHMLIKSKYDLDIRLDTGSYLTKIIARSKYGNITVYNDSYASYKKTEMNSCYFHTNPDDKDAMIYLRNVYAKNSFISAGKDLILRDCSGKTSSFYAAGSTDEDLAYYGRNYLYTTRDYNSSMQYGGNGYFNRYYRGIVFISKLPPKGTMTYYYDNSFRLCDFTTGESIFLCDPYYYISYGNQIVKLSQCRIMADREVLIEDVDMKECYTYAGIRGYEDEQDIYYRYGVPKLYVVRGIYMRVDHIHNNIEKCVFYSKGRMMYSQHTPESSGFPVTVDAKKRVYESFFYSINNFEYNGISTSEGLDTTIMRNNPDYCNNMIIMTESNLGPHEYSPSVANDVVFIGGNLGLDPTKPHYSGVLAGLIGEEDKRGIGDWIDVQCDMLYDNYFEQLLSEDEVEREIPVFEDVFLYEDIYEINEAGTEGN